MTRPALAIDRALVESLIETLVNWLDRHDGDPDCEPDLDAEPVDDDFEPEEGY